MKSNSTIDQGAHESHHSGDAACLSRLDTSTLQRFNAPTPQRAFTLIELLVVISVIAILAALIFPVTGAVNAAKIKARTKAELAELETAIDRYQKKRGHYPPDNPGNPALNQLYYELLGTTNDGRFFRTLDGRDSVDKNAVSALFGPKVTGFANSSAGGGGDETTGAENFLKDVLKPTQFTKLKSGATVLVGVPWQQGPAPFDFDPLANNPGVNPWRYNMTSPTNNPNSFDLWIEVRIGSKTYLISNWSKKPVPLTVHDPY